MTMEDVTIEHAASILDMPTKHSAGFPSLPMHVLEK